VRYYAAFVIDPDGNNIEALMNNFPGFDEFDFRVSDVVRRVRNDPSVATTVNAGEMSRASLHVNSLSRDRLCFSCQAWREECKRIDLKLELCRAYDLGSVCQDQRQPRRARATGGD